MLGEGVLSESQTYNYDELVEQVIADNEKTVAKIKKQLKKSSEKPSKKDGSGPIMFLVGRVMLLTNRQGDPQVIA